MTLPRLFKPFQQVHGDDVHRLMSDWFKSELGCQVLDAERDLLDHLPAITLSVSLADDILHGRLGIDEMTPEHEPKSSATPQVYRAYSVEGRFIAILSRQGAYWVPEKVFTGEDQS